MAFTISYNIQANDQFTAISKQINASIADIGKSVAVVNKHNAAFARSMGKVSVGSSVANDKIKEQNTKLKQLRRNSKMGAVDSRMLSDKFRKQASSLSSLNALTQRNAAATKLATQRTREQKRALAESKRQINANNRALRDRIGLQRQIGAGIGRFGDVVNTRVSLPLLAAGGASIKFAKDFNKSMANVGTLIPGQTAQLQQYKNEVLDLSVKYGKGAEIVSAGLYQVISNVGQTADTMKILNVSNKAAVAGVAQTADAVDLLTGVASDYGDVSAGMVQRLSDLAFKTVELGSTTFPQLASQMGKTTTLAATMGVQVEELFGQFAGLTSGTVNTAMVSTRLAGVMRALMNGAGGLKKAFRGLGVESGKELIAKFGGLQNAMFALKREVGGNEIAFGKLFADNEARLAALAMTGAKAREVADEVKQMGRAAGASDAAFREQSEGIGKAGFKMDQSIARIKRMSISIGDRLLPQVEKLLVASEPLVDYLSKLDQSSIDNAISIGKFAVGVGLASKAIGGMISMQAGAMSLAQSIGGVAGQVNSVSGAVGMLRTGIIGLQPVLMAAVAGISTGYAIWLKIEAKQKRELEHQNKKATLMKRARSMSYADAKSNLAEMEASWAKQERQAKILAQASGQKYTGTSLLTGEFSKNRAVRIEQENARALKRRMDSFLKAQRQVTSEFFEGQDFTSGKQSIMSEMMKPKKDVLEIRVKTDNGSTADVRQVRRGAYSNVEIGRN